MIESFKLPNITPETLTGSIVSFNDEYGGLPLKSCTSLISGYQEGTGTPSPSNIRNLVSFNSATLTENGNTHLFSFGTDIYSGSIDWKRGVVTGTYGIVDLGSLNYNYTASSSIFSASINNMASPDSASGRKKGILSSEYPTSSVTTINKDMDNKSMLRNNGEIYIRDTSYNDASDFKTAMNGVMLAYELAEPIEIPLGGINLLTQQGVNNIFCDTGDTTLEYLKAGR